jgi:hypothetical protein
VNKASLDQRLDKIKITVSKSTEVSHGVASDMLKTSNHTYYAYAQTRDI